MYGIGFIKTLSDDLPPFVTSNILTIGINSGLEGQLKEIENEIADIHNAITHLEVVKESDYKRFKDLQEELRTTMNNLVENFIDIMFFALCAVIMCVFCFCFRTPANNNVAPTITTIIAITRIIIIFFLFIT